MEQSSTLILVSLVAVVFVFLFAVKKFSHQVQYLAGDKIKLLAERFTNTKIKGLFSGLVLTSILQSSTAFIVILVSLADASIISFTNSIPMIIGANIGTTITTQLVAFKILNIAPYILVLGFILMNFKNKYERFGKPIFYFGLVFSSLLIISVLANFFQDSEIFNILISKTSNLFIAILVGIFISTILQSSSITTVIVVIFAGAGILSFAQSFGIILGTNIGTTSTALLASIVTGKQGRRVALANFLFNTGGVIIFLPFVGLFVKLITSIPVGLPNQVAISHLIFNILIAIVFLVFIKPFNLLIHKIIK
jgi:phosphate:Na+ symporter